jgi:hypothetical protein
MDTTSTQVNGTTVTSKAQTNKTTICSFVADFNLSPDADGKVVDSVSIPIDVLADTHLALYGMSCSPDAGHSIPTCDDVTTSDVTEVDFRLPHPRP